MLILMNELHYKETFSKVLFIIKNTLKRIIIFILKDWETFYEDDFTIYLCKEKIIWVWKFKLSLKFFQYNINNIIF